MSQMACPDNAGLFQKAVIMSAMIRSPYSQGRMGKAQDMEVAEENGKQFFDFLGVDSLEEARRLDAITIRDKYAEYAQTHPRMGVVEDRHFCLGDPLKLFQEGKCVPVAVMAGNTADEFPNFLMADSQEELEKRAKECFGDKAEDFLAFPEARQKDEQGRYARVSGIACTAKSLFRYRKADGKPCYYYCFEPDIPGWDNPGTFHSVDLWFFFETLAKCWRPFGGRHYDLARQMCNYWANFIKTGDPNGKDVDGKPMPQWQPYTGEEPCQMRFTSQGPAPRREEETAFQAFLMEVMRERISEGK